MAINVKNYTSVVPAEKSIQDIENALIKMGATAISKEYKDGKVESIQFAIMQGNNKVPFKLPIKKDSIYKLLTKDRSGLTDNQKRLAHQQAERTAWKNVKELVQLQHTMILLEQVEFMEVFMPYVLSMKEGKTFYEISKVNGFKQLTQ
jgi:hypothetical protein